MSKKLGTTKSDEDSQWEYVVVRVDLESGDVDEVDRCADDESATKCCARLNIDEGVGPEYVHAFMTVAAFDELQDVDEDDEYDDSEEEYVCLDPDCCP